MTSTTQHEKAGDPTAELDHPEKLGEQTKKVPYERGTTYSNPDELEEAVDMPSKVWIIEYYDRFQNYQPKKWAEVSETPEEAADELRKHKRAAPSTSFRAVRLDRKEVVRDE